MTFVPAYCELLEDYVYLTVSFGGEVSPCPNGCGEVHEPLL